MLRNSALKALQQRLLDGKGVAEGIREVHNRNNEDSERIERNLQKVRRCRRNRRKRLLVDGEWGSSAATTAALKRLRGGNNRLRPQRRILRTVRVGKTKRACERFPQCLHR